MRVEVDADVCGGFGTCIAKAPAVFALSDDGYAVVLVDEVPAEYEAAVQEAEVLCPTHAITLS
jgi:ferredoxin